MIFPFIGMMCITDGLTGILGGTPLFIKVINLNYLHIISIVLTVLFGAGVTETINVFGGEWKYLKMPFPTLTIYSIPLAVFVGWFPLVIGSITLVYFIKRLGYVWDKRKVEI
jgi:uncharacterized membrane protein